VSDWLQLLGGGLLLYFGAEWFVGGAAGLALALRVPQLLVGLTVVAYGTSAPEVVVGVQAAASGHGEVALANVVGSNIANIGLVLGVAALVRPPRVNGALRRRELPVLAACTVAVPLLLLDGKVARWEGVVLLVLAVGYSAWMIRSARSATALAATAADTQVAAATADAAGAPHARGVGWSAATAVVGLAVLVVGGRLFVTGAVDLARALGMSDRVVGLTIVAVGTSLPELVTSVIAAVRGHADLAVGNVVGSNVFNVLLCLGAAALTGPVLGTPRQLGVDLAVLVGMTTLLVVLLRGERLVARREGGLALGLYVAYVAYVLVAG
jgi:cation:H+ antiporter